MNLKEGEQKCKECDGTGKVIGDYPYSETCEKCGGNGKIDWITKAMGSIKKNSLDSVAIFASNNIPNDITFTMPGGNEVLKICENGDFYVKGRKVIKDLDVYNGFVDFLKGCGCYK